MKNNKTPQKAARPKIYYILTVVAVSVAIYLIIMPIIPGLIFKWHKATGFKQPQYVSAALNNQSAAELPKDNRLAIPSIGLNKPILDGQTFDTVNKGLWHRPNIGSPDKGGNTVIVGHRFMYFGDANQEFYNLDKVNIGDDIVIFWGQKSFKYSVVDKRIVAPTETSVEQQTKDAKLTLYTCTPIWTNKNRLVVVALPKTT
jgi:LPXTG-site transpeptidase (sortase) family protein